LSSASKGWRGRLEISSLPSDEEMEGSPAAADQTVLYTRSFPVVNAAKEITDDENEVTVKVDGVTQPPTAFTLEGAIGKITFGTAPGADKIVTITYRYFRRIGYIQGLSFSYAGNVEGLYDINESRLPVELLEGNIEIGFSAERAFIDRDFYGKVLAKLKTGSAMTDDAGIPEFTAKLYPLSKTSGKPELDAVLKFSTWELTQDQDAVIMDSIEGVCKSLTPAVVT